MSAYQVQRCLFDHLRRLEQGTAAGPDTVEMDGYLLADDERRALTDGDVAAFHDIGVHPVIINAYCRANGWKRADYRVLFRDDQRAVAEGRARWLTS